MSGEKSVYVSILFSKGRRNPKDTLKWYLVDDFINEGSSKTRRRCVHPLDEDGDYLECECDLKPLGTLDVDYGRGDFCCSVGLGHKIYSFVDGTSHVRVFDVSDMDGGVWRNGCGSHLQRYTPHLTLQACEERNSIIALGGSRDPVYGIQTFKDVEVFDATVGRWSYPRSLQTKFVSTFDPQKQILWHHPELSALFAFDLEHYTCTPVSGRWVDKYSHSYLVLNGILYFLSDPYTRIKAYNLCSSPEKHPDNYLDVTGFTRGIHLPSNRDDCSHPPRLVKIANDKICLLWSRPNSDSPSSKLDIRCTKFSVDRLDSHSLQAKIHSYKSYLLKVSRKSAYMLGDCVTLDDGA